MFIAACGSALLRNVYGSYLVSSGPHYRVLRLCRCEWKHIWRWKINFLQSNNFLSSFSLSSETTKPALPKINRFPALLLCISLTQSEVFVWALAFLDTRAKCSNSSCSFQQICFEWSIPGYTKMLSSFVHCFWNEIFVKHCRNKKSNISFGVIFSSL